MKYEVHWVRAWGMCMGEPYEDEHHGTFATLEEAQQSVKSWWQENKYQPRYIRQMTDEKGRLWWDYGIHSSFYMFVEVKDNEKGNKQVQGLAS